jgi:hypothetical protein
MNPVAPSSTLSTMNTQSSTNANYTSAKFHYCELWKKLTNIQLMRIQACAYLLSNNSLPRTQNTHYARTRCTCVLGLGQFSFFSCEIWVGSCISEHHTYYFSSLRCTSPPLGFLKVKSSCAVTKIWRLIDNILRDTKNVFISFVFCRSSIIFMRTSILILISQSDFN